MIRALMVLFAPSATWEKIGNEVPSPWAVLLSFAPFVAALVGLEAFAMLEWGDLHRRFGQIVEVEQAKALQYGIAQAAALYLGILISAVFVQWGATGFNFTTTYRHALAMVSYGYAPIILVRGLDAIPKMNTWICWAIGLALAFSTLYHGVAHVLKPDQTKGFGVYLVTMVILAFVSALAHGLARFTLYGSFA